MKKSPTIYISLIMITHGSISIDNKIRQGSNPVLNIVERRLGDFYMIRIDMKRTGWGPGS